MLSDLQHIARRYGQDAKAIAKAVREGVKQVYWVADGAEGVKGWKVSTTCSACNPLPSTSYLHSCGQHLANYLLHGMQLQPHQSTCSK